MTRSVFDPFDAPNRTHLWARLLIEELVRCGVRHAVVGPGSRSTPLTAAAALHPEIEDRVHVDERGGAFYALGCARASGRPAAWVTTSGTAVANGLPAAVEAARDHVPLVLLTADRPPELQETGSNQTIDQRGIFGSRVRAATDLPTPTAAIDSVYLLTSVDRLVAAAAGPPAGPVHLNCAYRKPLEPVGDPTFEAGVPEALDAWSRSSRPYTRYRGGAGPLAEEDLSELADLLAGAERGLLVAGRMADRVGARAVARCADRIGWPLLPDVSSQLRLGRRSDRTIAFYDLMLRSERVPEEPPDRILQFGDHPVSGSLRRYLRTNPPERRILLAPHADRIDPDHRVTDRYVGSAVRLADYLDARPAEETGSERSTAWTDAWTKADARASSALERTLEEATFCSEPGVARIVSREIPEDHALFLGNSRPVRDVQSYADPDAAGAAAVTNRGASGIDGSVATAAGYAAGAGVPVTAVLGDLALLHDLNSLALLHGSRSPVVLVVINNDGGGIFHFLPIVDYPEIFESHFAAPHGLSFADAAAQFDLAYARPTTPGTFRRRYREALDRSAPTLIEVVTDRKDNRRIHERLEDAVNSALASGPGQ